MTRDWEAVRIVWLKKFPPPKEKHIEGKDLIAEFYPENAPKKRGRPRKTRSEA
jgi:hypothetical protein